MGEMITKPDANPILYAICNWFGWGALGYFLMGQKKKAIIAVVIFLLVGGITCGALMLPIIAVFAYDAYLVGQKLQSGQSVGENENGLEFLNMIFKD